MFRWLVLSAVLGVCLTEEAVPVAETAGAEIPDSKAEESVRHNEHDIKYDDYGEDLPGTGVLREIHPSRHPLPRHRIEEQNKIVYDRYSPNYYQPTWILDYRYLKTGGRDYTRGEGGQILILPKGIKAPRGEHKQFGNFDELLEFLRLQELATRGDLHRRRTEGDKESHHGNMNHERQSYKNEEQNVGWRREAQREDRYNDNVEELLEELSKNDERDVRRERWQKSGRGGHVEGLNGWEREALGK